MLNIKDSEVLVGGKTLEQLFSEYIDECQYTKALRPQTITGYEAVFKHFSAIMPEVSVPSSLTREKLNEFFKRIRTRKRIVGRDTVKVGLQDSTIKTYSNKLNAFFVWLIQKGMLVANPLDNIKLRYPEYTDQRALKDEEVRKIVTSASLHAKSPLELKRDTVMLYLLFFCGLRAGEFISLRVTDLDWENGLLLVRGETSKSKRDRYIPMSPTLVLHLKEYIKERNSRRYTTENLIVSTTKDKGLSRHGLKHWVNKFSRLSGVKFHLHRFRHTFAMNLAKLGTHCMAIQKSMGHKDIKMTMGYLRSFTVEDAREGINQLSIV